MPQLSAQPRVGAGQAVQQLPELGESDLVGEQPDPVLGREVGQD
ncbi:MAG TPA: hypothetical protein VHB69_10220 [Mycobacteriales bacterium]|nr:hypothetical protein [Mycobacteriales bacterium]